MIGFIWSVCNEIINPEIRNYFTYEDGGVVGNEGQVGSDLLFRVVENICEENEGFDNLTSVLALQ